MPFLIDIETAFPKNYYSQQDLVSEITSAWKGKLTNLSRVNMIHSNVLVDKRHLAMPIQDYFELNSFDQRNDKFIEIATDIATEAIQSLLDKNDLDPKNISSLWSNTVTGFAIPSLEARVMNRINFKQNTKRVPLLGLGCMAGIAGINRVADYLKGHPDEAVIFISVELCSLTFQLEDLSAANLVSTGLFGDGAAAVLMVGDEHPLRNNAKMEWLDSESIFFPDTEKTMGWQVGASGLKIILSKGVPELAREELGTPIKKFLEKKQLNLSDIKTFMAHPGGPKVLHAMEEVFGLPEKGLSHSWDSLRENGNMSSVSVLDIIKRTLANKTDEKKKTYSLGVAMGPSFSAEVGLFKWL